MFWNFWRWRIWYFWAKKLMEIWYLLITEKFLFWSFREWKIRSFFKSKSWWKDDIYWLLRSSCSELFGDGKYGLFLSQKVDGKMIYTWSFWAFHDIPGLGKYGFSRSALQAENAGNTDLCIFFSRHAARFCSTLKVYCYRRRVSKIHENMRTQPAKLI